MYTGLVTFFTTILDADWMPTLVELLISLFVDENHKTRTLVLGCFRQISQELNSQSVQVIADAIDPAKDDQLVEEDEVDEALDDDREVENMEDENDSEKSDTESEESDDEGIDTAPDTDLEELKVILELIACYRSSSEVGLLLTATCRKSLLLRWVKTRRIRKTTKKRKTGLMIKCLRLMPPSEPHSNPKAALPVMKKLKLTCSDATSSSEYLMLLRFIFKEMDHLQINFCLLNRFLNAQR